MNNNGFLYHFPPERYQLDLCDRLFQDSHILIGGTNGSGKSVLINDLIYNIIATRTFDANDPEGVQFILIDPKHVELRKYIDLPHTILYACENDKIIDSLKFAIDKMDARYAEMQKAGIDDYNGGYIVIIIDELADLMTTCKKEVLPLLQRIAQLGRAAKIKLIAATQAPSREVIPSKLILNFTGRVALRCLSPIESRQIINTAGAEDLPKNGKCLYRNSNGELKLENIFMVPKNTILEAVEYITAQIKGNAAKNSTRTFKDKSEAISKIMLLIFTVLVFAIIGFICFKCYFAFWDFIK